LHSTPSQGNASEKASKEESGLRILLFRLLKRAFNFSDYKLKPVIMSLGKQKAE